MAAVAMEQVAVLVVVAEPMVAWVALAVPLVTSGAPEIIEQIFGDHGFANYSNKLSRGYPTRDYCVQYRETDFNFASRLMEEEGIFYFFTHSSGGSKMVIANSPQAHQDLPGMATVATRSLPNRPMMAR